ncbi:alpha/beta hydrolase-fold protein [Shewanella phaeophyticola]|uniref:Alpha/beta hydrolase-fold protein n=1 Tax=Shewanella phaeophyticola TaxID=2978345 RepID=A0ABT2P6S6_9GAMM|nr:alpha/beta hydrolase-fold protein [Shewanella sp. KJ10-1]MCT8988368.1 alpha/beta hydrolase-fold protein [Shewanella sp. KJ10-1]
MATVMNHCTSKGLNLWRRCQLIGLLLLSAVVVNAYAVNVPKIDAFPQPKTEILSVNSSSFGAPADFVVTLPHDYTVHPDKRYVVLLDLHPRSHLYLSGMHDWMSHNGGWPWLDTIIITAPDGHKGLGELKSAAIEKRGDQGLLDFFEQHLLPAIDKQYRTNGFRVFNGFTGNAGLVLHSLLNRPQLFNAYIAASPVLSDDFAFVLNDAPKLLKALKGKQRLLFMSTSDSDFEQRQLDSFAMLEDMLETHVNAQLSYKIKRFDGSYYMTQPILATAMGIEMIFNDVHTVLAADSVVSQQGTGAILAYYKRLSDEVYGFDVPAIDSLLALGASFANDNPAQAIAVYQDTLNAYPKAHTAYHALAMVYADLGELTKAITAEKQALASTDHPFYQHKYTQQLEVFQQSEK